ncbi:probable metal-nicotianamine transporter YSL9 isoform X3 [Sorghum bicolor]|nr:probable metal-nicotianamine transporter YSL9 isoform X3 [Sorghum bicolor]|eukprot:XP_021318968.1 probable metal-nicotianamine transporter YSL9 isoform X3 [Sorghum bicolor]
MKQERRRRQHQHRHHRPPPSRLELAMAHARDGGGHEEGAEAAVCLDGDSEAGEARGAGRVPPWRDQLTARGMVASLAVGAMYSVIVMKLALTTGLVPTLNVSAALIAFVILRGWTQALARFGVATRPFTRQEYTVVQTCAVACYSIATGGGFGSFLLGLNKRTYELAGEETEGNVPGSYKEPGIGWMTGFLFAVSFVGIVALIPLRKIMVIDYKLTYPSGTATAVLINGFHTTHGDATANFFFDFSLTYVGAGMICSHLVNLSLLLGALLSWGIMWPLISDLKGDWYPADMKESSMRSLQGYKAFICIALILGDGLYNFVKIVAFTVKSLLDRSRLKNAKKEEDMPVLDEIQRNEVFTKDSIPNWLAYSGYLALSVVAVFAIPLMFHEMKWYYVIIAYLLAPALGFCNAYGAGLTDINMAYNYGKVALFILAAWAGKDSGVVAGLVGCGLVKSLVSISADLMHDFKTGHLTLTSPRSMIIAQAIGTAMGCVIGPLTFFLFYKAFDIGNPDGYWKAPYALVYRNMAILGVQGFSALPKHCLHLCYGFFGFAVAANLMRDLLPPKYGKWVPLPMAMGVPFLVGASFAIDMCVGSLIVFIWHMIDRSKASLMVPAVASGLICGDGLWIFPESLLALFKINPPLCMAFRPSH